MYHRTEPVIDPVLLLPRNSSSPQDLATVLATQTGSLVPEGAYQPAQLGLRLAYTVGLPTEVEHAYVPPNEDTNVEPLGEVLVPNG
ncbi:hypothetical protein PLICRDRAFT_261561 [Plicaturopsis crispa FD-325 SS-3]|nr:hypothetical protein PLICRDRAFT_261561 [Plicaturopsis crispa FD-325 SS-3]